MITHRFPSVISSINPTDDQPIFDRNAPPSRAREGGRDRQRGAEERDGVERRGVEPPLFVQVLNFSVIFICIFMYILFLFIYFICNMPSYLRVASSAQQPLSADLGVVL